MTLWGNSKRSTTHSDRNSQEQELLCNPEPTPGDESRDHPRPSPSRPGVRHVTR